MRTDWSGSRIWLRRDFTLASVPANLDLSLFNTCDASIHVNGVLIHASTFQSTGYVRVPVSNLMVFNAGTNTLAVTCQKASFGKFVDVGLGNYGW